MTRLIFGTMLLLGAVSLSFQDAEAHKNMTPWLRFAQVNQEQCKPWQVRDGNGNCVDPPNLFHAGPDHVPAAGETCWAECECYERQTPAADNCAPCNYIGQVRTRN